MTSAYCCVSLCLFSICFYCKYPQLSQYLSFKVWDNPRVTWPQSHFPSLLLYFLYINIHIQFHHLWSRLRSCSTSLRYLIKGLPRDTSLIRKCASFLRRERWAWQPFWGWFWLLWEYDKIDGQSSWKDKIVIWGKDQSRQQFPCTDTFVKKYNSLEIKEHLLFWPLSFQAYVLRKGISGGFCQKGNMCFLSLTLHRCMDT